MKCAWLCTKLICEEWCKANWIKTELIYFPDTSLGFQSSCLVTLLVCTGYKELSWGNERNQDQVVSAQTLPHCGALSTSLWRVLAKKLRMQHYHSGNI